MSADLTPRTLGILAALLAMHAGLRAAEAVRHEVKVGSQTLVIPAPEGFERIDGIDPVRDKISNDAVAAAGNRYVIAFARPEEAASLRRGIETNTPRTLYAQTQRSMEYTAITPAQFESLRAATESDLADLDKKAAKLMTRMGADVSKSLSESLKNSVEVKIGEPVPLGVFERTRDSLGFSMMFRHTFNKDGRSETALKVAATIVVRVRDRVLFLYASSDRNSEADEAWVKAESLKWRDAIFAANSQTDAPASSTTSRLLQQFNFRSILLMAALGAAAGLIVYFVRRHQKPPTPPPPPAAS